MTFPPRTSESTTAVPIDVFCRPSGLNRRDTVLLPYAWDGGRSTCSGLFGVGRLPSP